MRNLLFVGNFLSRKGLTRHVEEDVADRLEQRGWIVYRSSSIKMRPLRLLDMIVTIIRCRRKVDAAHISLFSGNAFLWGEISAALLRHNRIPFAITLHGGNLPRFAKKCPDRIRRVLSVADRVFAPSGFLANELKEFRTDIEILPNGIDFQSYNATPAAREPRLLWLRAFHKLYDPTMAVHAFAEVLKAAPSARLRMVGPDKQDGSKQQAQRLANDLNVSAQIEFSAGVPKQDVPLVLKTGNIFLNTTTVDNTPVSLIEAMAAGLVIVSTDVGGIPFLVQDGVNGFLVPSGGTGAMASAVLKVLNNNPVADRVARAGREFAASFDWSVVMKRWEQVMKDLTGKRIYTSSHL